MRKCAVAVVLAVLASVGCTDKKLEDGWTLMAKTPIGDYVYKKHFEAEKVTVYCYGQYSISVVKD